jgi:hypothetical protein
MSTLADDGKVTMNGEMLLVDLGKKSRKQVRKLRKGTGKLVDEVKQCVDELRTTGSASGSSQPIVIIVREKRSRYRLF